MSKRRVWLAAAVGAVSAAVFAAWLVGVWGGGFATRVVDDIALLVFAVFASVCCLIAARRSGGRQRATWVVLAVGLGAWSVGEGVWCYYELWKGVPQTPFPSVGDAGFLIFPVAAAVALVLFPGGRGGQSRTRLLDGIIVAGSMFVVSWVTVLGSVYRAGAVSHVALVVSLAYPVGDLVLVTMTVLVFTRAHTAQRLTLALLTAGIALMALSDSIFAYMTATSTYRTGSLIDVGWLTAFVLFGLAAMSSTTEPVRDQRAVYTPRTRLWLPYVPLVVAGAVGVGRGLPGLGSGPVPGVALVVVIVVLLRQFVTVAENRRLLVTVAHQAFHDPLTGLANRALFTDRVDHALRRQGRDLRPLTVFCIDLDDFKLVNDSLGHAAGDDVLVRVAERLTSCLRDGDTVARLGGDEFAVLVDEGGAARPPLVADRIVEAFARPFMIDGHSVSVRPSIGLARASAHIAEESSESLLKHADLAMYAAKRAGAGGARWYRPDMGLGDVADDFRLRQDLIKAVANSDIGVAYQPIVDVATGAIRGAEALARWHHPEHGHIPPLHFIPMAEQAGLIEPLGLDILNKALAGFACWAQPGDSPPLRLAVNLSARQLTDPDFPGHVTALLDRHHVASGQLILEIAEGALLTNAEEVGAVAAALDSLGVLLALDDFGVGHSSLAQMTLFPLRILKIDRFFVEQIDTEPEQRDFFDALLQFGRSLGLEIIAEGVERPTQLTELRARGCDLAQGYHLGRPTDAAAFRQLLEMQSATADHQRQLLVGSRR